MEPIYVLCEGSGHRTPTGMCQMCGSTRVVFGDVVVTHNRRDIIAELQRGDFDPPEVGL